MRILESILKMEPWMIISLQPPPVQTLPITRNIDVLSLKHACENIIRVLSKQSPLHGEAALLSRFVYKYDKKFRNDIGYRNIRKTYSSLRKYMEINLLKDVENFTAVLPGRSDDFIPTRQMLEYVMSRIITFSKVMLRIYVCSKQGAIFYVNRVKRGEKHWMSLMPYALLSRIWSMCGLLLHHSTSWYSCLHPYLDKLQLKGLNFLPHDYKLPEDLYEWLDLKNLDTFGKINWTEKTAIQIGLDLDNEALDTFDNILEFASTINNEDDNMESEIESGSVERNLKVNILNCQSLETGKIPKIDYGQAISRESFKTLGSLPAGKHNTLKETNQEKTSKESYKILANFQKKNNEDKKSDHYFGKVTNVKSLQDFLEREETLRNDGSEKSLTKHLSFMQWHTLKTSLTKIGDAVLNNKRIERKLLKVWKEKCLDYL